MGSAIERLTLKPNNISLRERINQLKESLQIIETQMKENQMKLTEGSRSCSM